MNPVSAPRRIGSKRLIRMILRLTLSDRVIKLTSPSAIVQDIAMSGHGGLSSKEPLLLMETTSYGPGLERLYSIPHSGSR